MKKLMFFLALMFSIMSHAQTSKSVAEASEPSEVNKNEFKKNSVGGYIGFIEAVVYYERVIAMAPRAYTSFRLGGGHAESLVWLGKHINPSLVFVIGKSENKFECSGGFKYFVSGGTESGKFLPDFFVGYRYEERRYYARIGLVTGSLFSLGGGFKF